MARTNRWRRGLSSDCAWANRVSRNEVFPSGLPELFEELRFFVREFFVRELELFIFCLSNLDVCTPESGLLTAVYFGNLKIQFSALQHVIGVHRSLQLL